MADAIINLQSHNIVSSQVKRDTGNDWWEAFIEIKDENLILKPGDYVAIYDGPLFLMLGIVDENDYVYGEIDNTYQFNAYSFEYILDNQPLTAKNDTESPYMNQQETAVLINSDAASSEENLILAYENPSHFTRRMLYNLTPTSGTEWIVDASGNISNMNINQSSATPQAGIFIERLDAVPYWDGNLDLNTNRYDIRWKQFKFNMNSSRLRAINECREYGNMVFYCMIDERAGVGNPQHYLYYLHESAAFPSDGSASPLDTMGGQPWIFDAQSIGIVPDLVRNDAARGIFNAVEVVAVDGTSGRQWVARGTVTTAKYPIPWRYECSDFIEKIDDTDTDAEKTRKATSNQSLVNSMRDRVIDFLKEPDVTYSFSTPMNAAIKPYNTCRIIRAGITTDSMRITYVEHKITKDGRFTIVKCQRDSAWTMNRELNNLMGSDWKRQNKELKEDFFVDLTQIEVGTLIKITSDKTYGIARLKTGGCTKVRLLNNNN